MDEIKKLFVKEYVSGDSAIRYESGIKLAEDIERELSKGGTILVDFQHIKFTIPAFLNPMIERMNRYPRRVSICANEKITSKINWMRTGGLLKREDFRTEEIEEV